MSPDMAPTWSDLGPMKVNFFQQYANWALQRAQQVRDVGFDFVQSFSQVNAGELPGEPLYGVDTQGPKPENPKPQGRVISDESSNQAPLPQPEDGSGSGLAYTAPRFAPESGNAFNPVVSPAPSTSFNISAVPVISTQMVYVPSQSLAPSPFGVCQ
jgi:hypothetical protein